MSLLTNNNTIHLYNRWISPWYENNFLYSNLIYSDLYIYEYINGIYYQLKMPNSIVNVKNLNFNQIIIRLNLYLFKKRKQRRSSLFFNNKIAFFAFYKKMNYLLHKSLFINRQYKKKYKYGICTFSYVCVKKYLKRKNVLSLVKIKEKTKQIKRLYKKYAYRKYLKRKKFKYLKNKRVRFRSFRNRFFKNKFYLLDRKNTENKIKFYLIPNFFLNIFSFNKFININQNIYIFRLGNYHKVYSLEKNYISVIKYNNKNLSKYYYYIKKRKKFFKVRKRIKFLRKKKTKKKINKFIIKCKNYKKKNLKLKIRKKKKRLINFFKKKIKISRIKNKYKKKKYIVKLLKGKLTKLFLRKISKGKNLKTNFKKLNRLKIRIYRNIIRRWNIFSKKKYTNRIKFRKFLYYFNHQLRELNNVNYKRKKLYLKKKKNLTNKKLILRKIKNRRKRKKLKRKNRKLYIIKKKKKRVWLRKKKKWLKKKKKRSRKKWSSIQRNYIKIKIIKKKLEKYSRKYKKKKSKKLRRNAVNTNMSFSLFSWIYKKLILWYYLLIIKLLLIKHIFYQRKENIVSLFFYRLNINIRFIKNKMLTDNVSYHFNKLIFLNRKKLIKKHNWFNNFYLRLMLYHLRLKITQTLSLYLGSNVLFFPFYKKKFFAIQDVKLLSDFIKLKLQYGRSIIKVLRKIIKIHNYQRIKLRTRNKRYKLKMIIFKRKIRNRIIGKFRLIFQRSNLLVGKEKYKKTHNRYNFEINNKIKINEFKKLNRRLNFDKYNNKLNLYLSNHNKLNFNDNNLKLLSKTNNILIGKKKKNYRMKRVELSKHLTKWRKKFRFLNYKHYPLIGIRIECNGPTKKGRRTKMITYNEWVNYYKLPGKMPYSARMADVQYWQTYARTKRAAIGIKIWLFFNSSLNSLSIGKARKNIKYKL